MVGGMVCHASNGYVPKTWIMRMGLEIMPFEIDDRIIITPTAGGVATKGVVFSVEVNIELGGIEFTWRPRLCSSSVRIGSSAWH